MENRHDNNLNRQLKIEEIANFIIRAAKQKNKQGFTLSPASVQEVEFEKNTFLVSLVGLGARYTKPPTKRRILKWLRKNQLVLLRSSYYIGGWKHDGFYFLDISIPVVGIRSAITTGFMNSQESIYDAYAKKIIFLKYPKRRTA